MKWKNVIYAPIGWALKGLALMPWKVLYFHADIIYLIIYKIIKYRVKVVRQNLAECFPEKDEQWRHDVERQFYRHFADYFVETVKLLHISDDDMRRRLVFKNVEVIEDAIRSGQGIVLYAAHYANWEWITSVTLWFQDDTFDHGAIMGQVYQPLENEWFDRFFLNLRERFRTKCFTKQAILREMLTRRREGRQMAIGFISDQHPIVNHENYIRLFLNHPTAIITGPEAIARKLNTRAAYFDIRKLSRGHYECTLIPMSDNCADTEPHQLTDRFTDILEKRIKAEPAYWLWTHKRWKRPVSLPQS